MSGKIYSFDVEVRYRDIDMHRHVNHAVYFSYFEEIRNRFLQEVLELGGVDGFPLVMAKNSCEYLRQVRLNDKLRLFAWTHKIGSKSFVQRYKAVDRNDESVVYARSEAALVWFDQSANVSKLIPEEVRERLAEYQDS